jgi:hypothetical protein
MLDHFTDDIDLDHLDFSGAIKLVAALDKAIEAVANYSGSCEQLQDLAILHAKALCRQHQAFRELEQKQAAKARDAARLVGEPHAG